jgi:putative ATPase
MESPIQPVHDHPNHYIPQQYLPDSLQGARWYAPSNQGYEACIAEWLAALRGG